jgi:cell division protein FtsI (penicillin-binding protein 3)
MPENKETKDIASNNNLILIRYSIIVLLLICPVVIGILTLTFRIAFVEKSKWESKAKSHKRPDGPSKPNRGDIYSSDGKLMATTVSRYYMRMDFKADGFRKDTFLYSRENGIDSLAFYLSKKLKNRSAAGFKKHLLRGMESGNRAYPVYEGRVSYTDLKEIKQFPFIRKGRNVSGFHEIEIVQRQKLFGMMASRTIGDICDTIGSNGLTKGINGLELYYDSLLHGEAGLKSIRRVGRQWNEVADEEPVNGMDLQTTIDIQIQDFTEKALVDKLREIDAESGTAIVMEVRTGEIKAISNMGRVRSGVYAERRNYAVTEDEPGSTFKTAAMMVALEDKVCTPDETVNAGNGIYPYKNRYIIDHNADKGGYHQITVAEAVWYSSNIGVAKMILKGYEQNPKKFINGLHRIGIDADLKLEIPGAGRTKIQQPGDSLWSPTSLPWISFGYGVEVPPINMLAFYNAIANNGKMVRPIFTKEIRQNDKTVQRFTTDVLRSSICSRETLKTIREMLVNVVEKGTGSPVHSDAVSIAGKTGTAQILKNGKYQRDRHRVSFCGYFPADQPQYSCIVVITHPRIGYPSGGTMPGGVFKTIAEKIYAYQTKSDLLSMDDDPEKVSVPNVKNGNAQALEYVLDELNIKTNPKQIKSGYVIGERKTENNYIEIKKLTVRDHTVPYVIGMGAKDAVYTLEKCGLRVNLSGRGKVVSQSVSPGQQAVKGQTVAIVLKN